MANYTGIALDQSEMHADESNFLRCYQSTLINVSFSGGGVIANFASEMPEDNNMETYQGLRLVDRWYGVRLVDYATRSTPKTLIPFGNIIISYGFEGAVAETNMPVLITDWAEQGGGDYWLQMGLTEFANYGKYTIRVSSNPVGLFADRSFVVDIDNPVENIFGTAQSGAPNSIQLAIGESAQNHIYNQDIIYISRGLGAGQKRVIMDYDGVTKIAVVDRVWDINPNGTSEYIILPRVDELISNQGIALAGSPTTIQLAITASAINAYYVGSLVYIVSGTGAGQSPRIITGYIGGTTTATVYPAWTINPDITSVYKVIPLGQSMVDAVEPALQALLLGLIENTIIDADLALHLGAGVGGRNIGNILGQLAQSEFEQRTNVFALAPIIAQGIDDIMVARGCIQYQQIDMSYTKNYAAPDGRFYLLYHYNIQRMNDIVKASLVTVW